MITAGESDSFLVTEVLDGGESVGGVDGAAELADVREEVCHAGAV